MIRGDDEAAFSRSGFIWTWRCRDQLSKPFAWEALNSAHIFGTLVPVAEPSTASITEAIPTRDGLLDSTFHRIGGQAEADGGE
jgi:hypothetical protein